MSGAEVVNLVVGVLTGILSSTLFVLALFIGFCVLIGFTKTKKTAGGNAPGQRRVRLRFGAGHALRAVLQSRTHG